MDTKQEPTFDQDLSTIVTQLPASIRAFFASGKVEIVAKNLMQKYKLHIDQGAVVEREIILLLLGLKSPEDFAKTLAEEAELDQQTVNGIVQDVNAQIFMPLRNEMRKGPVAAPQPPRVNVQSQTPTTAPKYAPIPKFPHLLQKKLPDKKLLEDHEEPHIEFKKVQPPLRHAVAFGEGGPPNLPGAIHHPPLPTPPPLSKPIQPTVPPPKPTIPPPQAKPYSSDPYREPIDEK